MTLFYNKNNTALTSVNMEREKMITIETTAIDDIDILSNFDIIKIKKVDTEGHDLISLKGALNTLNKTQYGIVDQNVYAIR